MRLGQISVISLVCSSAAARDLSAVTEIANSPIIVLVDKAHNPHEWQPKHWDQPIDPMVQRLRKTTFFKSAAQRHPNESWRGHGKRKKKHLKEINKY